MTPLHVGTSYTHDLGLYSKGIALATHQIVWAGSLKPSIAWTARRLNPLLMRGTPFKSPHVLVI